MQIETIKHDNPEGPYIVWQNYGCEGWKPTSYSSLRGAITDNKFCSEWVVTKPAAFQVVECEGFHPDQQTQKDHA